MASVAPHSDRPLPPLVARIDGLLNSLGAEAGLPTVGPRERMTVQVLLMRLADREALPADPRSLAQTIGPVICSTPRQQKLFAERCETWAETVLPKPRPPVVLTPQRLIARAGDTESETGGAGAETAATLPWIAIVAVTAVTGLGALLWYAVSAGWFDGGTPTPAQVPTTPSQTGILSQAEFLQLLISAVPTLGFLFYLYVRRRKVVAAERGFVPRDADSRRLHYSYGGEGLFRREGLRAKLVGLKQYRMAPTRRIDVGATIAKALETLGQVHTIIRREKPVLVETVVLVDRRSGGDHAAALGDAMVARLRQSDVPVQAFDFHANPMRCRRHFGREAASIQPFAAIAGRHLEDALILFTDGSGLVDRLTLRPGPWFQHAKGFAHIGVLTPTPMVQWGSVERTLMRAGVTVLPATPDGVAAYADIVSHIFDDTDHMPARDLSVSERFQRRFPRLLARRPERLLDEFWDGQETDTDRIVAQLQSYLDPQAFELLCALAVFPKVHPELTLFLGLNLFDDRGLPLLNEYRLSHLSQLVWLRKSYIPNWLRVALIGKLDPERQERVRVLLVVFQQAALDRPLTADDMEIDIVDPPSGIVRRYQSWLGKQSEQSELRDVVYLRFMNRQDLGDLQAEAAGQLVDRLKDREIQISGAGLAAAVACSVFVFTYYGKLTQFAGSARNLISSLLEPVVAWGYANQSLFSWALLTALGLWFLRIAGGYLLERIASLVQSFFGIVPLGDPADRDKRSAGATRPNTLSVLSELVPSGLASVSLLSALALFALELMVTTNLYDSGSHRFNFLTAVVASGVVFWVVQASPGAGPTHRMADVFADLGLWRAATGVFVLVVLMTWVQASTTADGVLGALGRLFFLFGPEAAVTLIVPSIVALVLLSPAFSRLGEITGAGGLPTRDMFDTHAQRLAALLIIAIAGRALDLVVFSILGGASLERAYVFDVGFYTLLAANMLRYDFLGPKGCIAIALAIIAYLGYGQNVTVLDVATSSDAFQVNIAILAPVSIPVVYIFSLRGSSPRRFRLLGVFGAMILAAAVAGFLAGAASVFNFMQILGLPKPADATWVGMDFAVISIASGVAWAAAIMLWLRFHRRDAKEQQRETASLRNLSPAWLFLPLVMFATAYFNVEVAIGTIVIVSGELFLMPMAAWLGWRYGRSAIAVIAFGALPLILRGQFGGGILIDSGVFNVVGFGTPGAASHYAIAVMIAWIFSDLRVPRAIWNADRFAPLAMLAMIAVLNVSIGIPISGRAVGISVHWALLFYFLCFLIGLSRVRIGPFLLVIVAVILAGIVLYTLRLDRIAYGLLTMSLALDSWTSLFNVLGCLALGRGLRLVITDRASTVAESLALRLLSIPGLAVLCGLAAADVYWGLRFNPGYFFGASGLAPFSPITTVLAAALFFTLGVLHGRHGMVHGIAVLLIVGLAMPLGSMSSGVDIGELAPALMDGSITQALPQIPNIIAMGILCYLGWRVRDATHALIGLEISSEDSSYADATFGSEPGTAAS